MRVSVSFDVEVPDDMTSEQIDRWIGFEVGHYCDMKSTHPQMDRDLNPLWGTLVTRPA